MTWVNIVLPVCSYHEPVFHIEILNTEKVIFKRGSNMPTLKKLIILLFLSILIFSCGKTDTSVAPEVPEEDAVPVITEVVELEAVETPENKQAMITFITGDVFKLENNEWIYLEIGDLLEEHDSIQVESGSFCEIQFGDKAVVRVEENTELSISNIFIKTGETKIGIDLAVGSVLVKVQKLVNEGKFNVKTQSAVCGVRGTQFSVKSEPGIDTVLAVKEGSVAILPPELNIEELIKKAGESGETVAAILETIESSASVVVADEEISLTEESFEEIKESVRIITAIVEAISVAEENEEPVLMTVFADLTEAAGLVTKKTEDKDISVNELSAENKNNLKNIEEMRMISIPVSKLQVKESAEKDNGNETAEDASDVFLHKFGLKIIPANAEILLNSKKVGTGSFSGIFEEGDILNFKFISDNFEPQNISFTISKETSKQYTISLEKTRIEPEAKKKEKETEVLSEEKFVETKQETEKQEIIVEEVTIEKNPVTEVSVIEKVVEEIIMHEPLPVVSVLSLPGTKIVGSLSTGAKMIYASDSEGRVSAISSEGRLVWELASANKSVENSYPVFSNNRIYFSGSSEFLVIDAFTGKIIEQKNLNKNTAHIFGRRLVPFGNRNLFPSNDEIKVLDSSSGDLVSTITLPGNGSRMTPAVWNNKVLTVDQNGTMVIINPDNGTVENEIITSGSQPIALTITIQNNLAIFSGRKGKVVCIDLNAKNVLWETQLNGRGSKVQVYTDIISSTTGIYIYTKGTIHSLNIDTGQKLFDTVSNVSSPPILANNQLVFGDAGNNLVFMNSFNGKIDKVLNLDDTVSARPVVFGKLIAAGTQGGNLLIINPEDIE
jgi:outer membrane protein assembly factor BamB